MKLKNNDDLDLEITPTAESRAGSSRLGPGITVNGEINGKEDLIIEGHYQGKIILADNTLTVERSARLQAEIQAKNISIKGSVQGNISASGKVLIRKDAQLDGDIIAARISIEDGAQFKGSVKMNTNQNRNTPSAGPAPSLSKSK
jgi:cytoskeletal protein CcmA (bactofilin family)